MVQLHFGEELQGFRDGQAQESFCYRMRTARRAPHELNDP